MTDELTPSIKAHYSMSESSRTFKQKKKIETGAKPDTHSDTSSPQRRLLEESSSTSSRMRHVRAGQQKYVFNELIRYIGMDLQRAQEKILTDLSSNLRLLVKTNCENVTYQRAVECLQILECAARWGSSPFFHPTDTPSPQRNFSYTFSGDLSFLKAFYDFRKLINSDDPSLKPFKGHSTQSYEIKYKEDLEFTPQGSNDDSSSETAETALSSTPFWSKILDDCAKRKISPSLALQERLGNAHSAVRISTRADSSETNNYQESYPSIPVSTEPLISIHGGQLCPAILADLVEMQYIGTTLLNMLSSSTN